MRFSEKFKLYDVDCDGDIIDSYNAPIIDFEWEGYELSQDDAHKLLRKIYKSGELHLPEDVKYVGLYHNRIFGYKHRPYINNRENNRAGFLIRLPGIYKIVDRYCFDNIDDFIKNMSNYISETNHKILEELKDDVKGCSVVVCGDGIVLYSEHPISAWCIEYVHDDSWTLLINNNEIEYEYNKDITLKEIQAETGCFIYKNCWLSVEDLNKEVLLDDTNNDCEISVKDKVMFFLDIISGSNCSAEDKIIIDNIKKYLNKELVSLDTV